LWLNLQEHWTKRSAGKCGEGGSGDSWKRSSVSRTTPKKVITFLGEKKATTSVTAPGDTNPSDATEHWPNVDKSIPEIRARKHCQIHWQLSGLSDCAEILDPRIRPHD